MVQPTGVSLGFLRCRRLISPNIEVEIKINCSALTSSSLTDSIGAVTSFGTRGAGFRDLCFAVITKDSYCWWVLVYLMASWPQPLGSMPNLRSFSLQPSLAHPLKFPLPATDSICANKASSKRIIFRLLPERAVLLFKLFPWIDCHNKQRPTVLKTLAGHLTTNDNNRIETVINQNTTHSKGRNNCFLKSAVQSKSLSLAGRVLATSLGGSDMSCVPIVNPRYSGE